MRQIDTIHFIDHDSGEKAIATVRATSGQIALCLSIETNGDIEVVMGPNDCKTLLDALSRAVIVAKDSD